MKALQIQQFGDPGEALRLVDLADLPLRKGDVRIAIQAAGINPSDVLNARGKFSSTTLPRVIGRDFAGKVVEGPPEMLGEEIWGSGSDLGFTRDGTHAERIDIPVGAVSLRPGNLSPEEAAVVGVPYTAAYLALEGARHKRGEWVIVTGAGGAVGTAALDLVHARGGYSIALVKDAREQALLDPKKFAAVATSEAGNLEAVVRDATEGRGADVALNGIGASVAPAILESLATGGRMAVYATGFGGSVFSLDLSSLYVNRLELIGVTTGDLDAVKAAALLNDLKPLFEKGLLDPPQIAERYPLERFSVAYQRAQAGIGKVIFSM